MRRDIKSAATAAEKLSCDGFAAKAFRYTANKGGQVQIPAVGQSSFAIVEKKEPFLFRKGIFIQYVERSFADGEQATPSALS